MKFFEVLKELSTIQVKELMIENFGVENSRYHTLDEIPFYKLLNKVTKTECSLCGKLFILDIEGGKELPIICPLDNNKEMIERWFCLNCYWDKIDW